MRNLFERLSCVAELRHITDERNVTMAEFGSRKRDVGRLYYEPPPRTQVVHKTVDIPEYPEASAELVVFEMNDAQPDPAGAETHNGILISGRRGVYMNTLFTVEQKPNSRYLMGHLRCAYIDDLIRQFDDREASGQSPLEENPMRLTRRSRDGLVDEHPFTKSLKKIFSTELLPLVESLEKRHEGERALSESTRRQLDELSRPLAEMLSRDLADMEQEEDWGLGEKQSPIAIIPRRVVLRPHERKTLTVHIRPALLQEEWDRQLEGTSDQPATVSTNGQCDDPATAPADDGLVISRLRVTAGGDEGSAVIRVRAGTHEAACVVTVTNEAPPEPPPPDGLQFSHDRYNLRLGRRRKIQIRAPLDLVAEAGQRVIVSLDGDPKISLLTKTLELRLDPVNGCYVGDIEVLGEEVGASGTVTAVLGDHRAISTLSCVDPKDERGLELRIHWSHQPQKSYRASLEQGPSGHVLTIFGRHPAIEDLLGKWDESERSYANDGTDEVKVVLSEIIAAEMTHYLVEREFNQPGQQFDPAAYAAKYRRRLNKYVAMAQKMLLSTGGAT